jgi:hypothetical protein
MTRSKPSFSTFGVSRSERFGETHATGLQRFSGVVVWWVSVSKPAHNHPKHPNSVLEGPQSDFLQPDKTKTRHQPKLLKRAPGSKNQQIYKKRSYLIYFRVRIHGFKTTLLKKGDRTEAISLLFNSTPPFYPEPLNTPWLWFDKHRQTRSKQAVDFRFAWSQDFMSRT